MDQAELAATLQKAALRAYEEGIRDTTGANGGELANWCFARITYKPEHEFFVVVLVAGELHKIIRERGIA